MHRLPAALVLGLAAATPAHAQLGLVGQFASGVTPVGCAHDQGSGVVWIYEAFGTLIRKYSVTGTALGTVARPGSSSDDADLEVAPVAFVLGTTLVPAGSLLFIDGESGGAEIYAIDPATGAVFASLATSFGNSHVVGGAFHVQRGTFFLVQDRVPATAAQKNLVAEVDPATGQVLGSFQTTQANPAFTVNYGDLEVTPNGNLLIVSSDETEIGEFTPQGAWLLGHPLPVGVPTPSGIAVEPTGCGLWLASPTGQVSQLTGTCPTASTFAPGCSGVGANNTLTATALPWIGSTFRAKATGLPPVTLVLAVTGLQPIVPGVPLSALLAESLPGCDLNVVPDILEALFSTTGEAEWQLTLDANPTFVGVPFYHQFVVLDLDPVTLAIDAVTSTNALQLTIGSY